MFVDFEAAANREFEGFEAAMKQPVPVVVDVLVASVKDEEEAVDWHEAQLGIIAEIGKEKYLAEQL